MMSAISRCSLVVVTALCAGCFGLAAGTYGKHQMARSEFGLAAERNTFTFTEQRYSESEVVALWGEPDRRDRVGGCHVLGYKNGRSWSGAGVFVGIAPVPLVVPSGSYWNFIYLTNDRTVGAVIEYGEIKDAVGVTCGSNDCEAVVGDAGNQVGEDVDVAVRRWCGETS